MEKVILGIAGTIALGVMAWAAKTAIREPKMWAALRPFILSAFAMCGMFGIGVLAGQHDATTVAGWALGIGGAAGVFACSMLNILTERMDAHRPNGGDG